MAPPKAFSIAGDDPRGAYIFNSMFLFRFPNEAGSMTVVHHHMALYLSAKSQILSNGARIMHRKLRR